jgi:hypothetical protein
LPPKKSKTPKLDVLIMVWKRLAKEGIDWALSKYKKEIK